jgi:uncharacterized protein YodC (DUF2158 family)
MLDDPIFPRKMEMAAAKYKVGDVVRLKSGGPDMTVQSVSDKNMSDQLSRELLGDDDTIKCQWFSGTKLQHGRFNPQTLESVNSDED